MRNLLVHVGTGGWDYLPTDEEDRLKAYSKMYGFVEVNSTFYQIPRLATVRSWRRRVPRDFLFSIKCNGVATHVHGLRPVNETFSVLDTMFTMCRMIRSDMLVLQTSPTLNVDDDKVRAVSSMLKNLNRGEVQVLWETRTPMDPQTAQGIRRTMLAEGITPIVDLSREEPPHDSGMIYSRLFGPEEFSDELIRKIQGRVSESKAERVVLAFHGASMYRDARRYMEIGRNHP